MALSEDVFALVEAQAPDVATVVRDQMGTEDWAGALAMWQGMADGGRTPQQIADRFVRAIRAAVGD